MGIFGICWVGPHALLEGFFVPWILSSDRALVDLGYDHLPFIVVIAGSVHRPSVQLESRINDERARA